VIRAEDTIENLSRNRDDPKIRSFFGREGVAL
jgi:hypothetical protein